MSKEHDHSHAHTHDHSHGHGCCGHDHAHEHAHTDTHTHEHKHECCGHEHGPDHTHEHKHDASCGHDHAHEHAHGCCGHDHDHDHDHNHGDAEWTRRFFAFLQGMVLILIGGVMVYFVASGRINGRNAQAEYVTGGFKWLALGGGLGLIVMGLFNWMTGHRKVDCCHDHGDDEEEGAPHVHSHDGSAMGRALTLLVLSGSVAAAAMFTPDGYSARFALHKGSAYAGDANSVEMFKKNSPEVAAASAAAAPGGFTLAKVEEYIKRTKEGNFPLSIMNLHYMGADQEYATVMDGQPVETVGQVVKDELNPGPKNLRVFTMQVTCCAADARPYSVPLAFEGAMPDFVEMGWYKVVGKLEFTQERGMKMARLRVAKPTDMQATIRPDQEKPGY